MKTEAIHPFFSESTWPQVISSGNILPPDELCQCQRYAVRAWDFRLSLYHLPLVY